MNSDPFNSPECLAAIAESKRNAEKALVHDIHLQSIYGWGVAGVKPIVSAIAERQMPLKASGTPVAVNQQPPKPLRWWERWERELYKSLGVTDGSGKADRGSSGSVGAEAHAREQDERDGK